MTTKTTNRTILFQALGAIVLPQFQQPTTLVQRRENMLARLSEAKLDKQGVRHVATIPAVLGDEWQFIPGVDELDWALMRLRNDPLYVERHRFPITQSVLSRVRAVKKAGIKFDDLWIAHEVEKGAIRPGQTLTREDLLPNGSALEPVKALEVCVTAATILGEAIADAWQRLTCGWSSRSAPSGSSTWTPGQDPILFGVIIEDGVADLFYLGHWVN